MPVVIYSRELRPAAELAPDAPDAPDLELTQYDRGNGLGLGLQLLAGAAGYVYLTPDSAAHLGALLVTWARDVRAARAA